MPGPYELYLVRHAIAEERGDEWSDDAKRPLTSSGMSRMKKAVRGLKRLDVSIEVILSSPLVRARQTAEILSAGLDPNPTIVNLESLAPGGTHTALIADLQKHARKCRIALVGHEPSIGELAARLIGSRHAIAFKKGAICRIDLDEIPPSGPGDLRWFLTPRILRGLKK
jgi:phosphohistidine phosphatase